MLVSAAGILGVLHTPPGRRLVRSSAVSWLRTQGVTLAIEDLRYNLFTLTVDLTGVRAGAIGSQVPFLTADRIHADLPWSLVSGEVVRTIQGFSKEATSICHVGVGDQFLATGGDGKVRLINESGGDARTFAGASDFMYAGAATPDGRIVIAGGQDGVLRVWNGANGNSIATFEPPKAAAPEPQKTAAVGK